MAMRRTNIIRLSSSSSSSLLSSSLSLLLTLSGNLSTSLRFPLFGRKWSACCLFYGIILLSCSNFTYAIINGPTSSPLLPPAIPDSISESTQSNNDYQLLYLIRGERNDRLTADSNTHRTMANRTHYHSITTVTNNGQPNNLNMNNLTTTSRPGITQLPIRIIGVAGSDARKFYSPTTETDSDTLWPTTYHHTQSFVEDTMVDINGSLQLYTGNRTFYQECLLNRKSATRLLTIIMYSVVCVIGLCGNTLVIYVVLRFSKMQTVTNIYILNLAIADECFLIGIPILLYTMNICSWHFGEYMCKFYMISTSITQFTSSIFLLIMAADRYIAVCHPIESPKYRTINIAKFISMLAWIVSAILMLPVVLFARSVRHEDDINVYSCNIVWPENYRKHTGTTFTLYTFLLGFAVPLGFILIFYLLVIRKLHSVQLKHKSKDRKRSNRKVTRLVLTVIAVYILCWLPHWISQVSLIIYFNGQRELSRLEILLFLMFGCLAYSNSAMNPVLYAFLSDNFRKSFSKAFTCVSRQDINAQLLNEPSIYTQKRTTGSVGNRAHRQPTAKHLTVLKRLPANPRENLNQSLLVVAPTTRADISLSGLSGISGTSASTATTSIDKSSQSDYSKTTTTTELNGNLVDNRKNHHQQQSNQEDSDPHNNPEKT